MHCEEQARTGTSQVDFGMKDSKGGNRTEGGWTKFSPGQRLVGRPERKGVSLPYHSWALLTHSVNLIGISTVTIGRQILAGYSGQMGRQFWHLCAERNWTCTAGGFVLQSSDQKSPGNWGLHWRLGESPGTWLSLWRFQTDYGSLTTRGRYYCYARYITCWVMGYQIHFNLILDHHWLVSPNYQFTGCIWTSSVFWWWASWKHILHSAILKTINLKSGMYRVRYTFLIPSSSKTLYWTHVIFLYFFTLTCGRSLMKNNQVLHSKTGQN